MKMLKMRNICNLYITDDFTVRTTTCVKNYELLICLSSGVTECVACNFVLELLPVTVRLHRNDLAGNSANCMKVSLHNASIRVKPPAGREAEI